MEGVTTAIVGFIFVCLVYPRFVKNKPQFYAALGLVLLIILFDAIGNMADSSGLHRVMYVLMALLQILAIVVLVLCVGGLSISDLAGEMANSVEVLRRGEDKPVLVPLRGEEPRVREDQPAAATPTRRPPPARPKDDTAIPLE